MKELALTFPGGEILRTPSSPNFDFSLNSVLQTGLKLMLVLAILLALFFIIWAGIQWIMSGGNKEGLEKAKGRLTYAIIGLIVALFAFAIINVFEAFLGINLVQ